MKIRRLDLRAYGPFTDVTLDLSDGSHGLHLIYGPNEAGKTSTLRAIEAILYGIPPQTTDRFVHEYASLRIGATLALRDGRSLSFVRRKAVKGPLRDADDDAILQESDLAPFLAGVSQDEFRARFGIDHERLRAGGLDLLADRGKVGNALFSAGAGLRGAQEVLRRLQAEMDALFKPNGSNPAINKRIKEVEAAKRAWQDSAVPSVRWVEHRDRLDAASADLARIVGELRRLRGGRARLDDVRKALPVIAEWRLERARRQSLGAVRLLPDDFAELRRSALVRRQAAAATGAKARAAIEEAAKAEAELDVPEGLLAEAPAIERLRDRAAVVREAEAGRPRLLDELRRAEAEADDLLRAIRPDACAADVGSIRVTDRLRARVDNLALKHGTLRDEARRAARQIEAQSALLGGSSPAGPDAEGYTSSLAEAVKRARSLGDLEARRDEFRAASRTARRQAAADLAALGLGGLPPESADGLPIPSDEAIDRFDAAWSEADRTLADARMASRAAMDALAEAERRAERAGSGGGIPTEADLDAARRLRDDAWRAVRDAWTRGEPIGRSSFADDFERALAAADALADRLRREADRVAELARSLADHGRARSSSEALRLELSGAEAKRDAVRAEWSALWRASGIEPGPPREMRAWASRFRAAVSGCNSARKLDDEACRVDAAIDEARREVAPALEALGLSGPGEEPLTALLDRADATVARLRSESAANRALDAARRAHRKARARLRRWKTLWARVVEPLGLPTGATPEQAAAALRRVDDLTRHLREARALGDRLAAIDREAEAFADEARELAVRVAPDLAGLPAGRAADAMAAALKRAVDARTRRESLRVRLEDERATLDESEAEALEAEARLATLCREAGCGSPDDLPEFERRSDEARRLDDRVGALERQLLGLSGAPGLDALVAEADAADPTDLDREIDRLDAAIQAADRESAALNQAIGAARNELEKIDGNATCAEKAEELEAVRARLSAEVDQYVRLRLTHKMLREAVESYRQKHQGPLLARAGDLFARLTIGSFEGLRVDYDDDAERAVLRGVRPGGSAPVNVEGMSAGTADQLYLALRLASLEAHLVDREPMPLVVDDILIQCDDDRAGACLDVLAAFSTTTQVLYFTHHEHLVRLATERLDPRILTVHHLPARAVEAFALAPVSNGTSRRRA